VGLLGSVIRWLELLAFGVFTYQQTRSALWVAAMTMLRMLPLTLFGVAIGTVAARFSPRRCLFATQGMALATTLVLLAASALGVLEVWHLAIGVFVSGVHWAGDMPLRRGLIGDLVGPQRMSQAMALDGVAGNGSRLAGPTLGGLLLAAGGMTAVLAAAAVMYAAGLLALAGIHDRVQPRARDAAKGPGAWSTLVAGLRAARQVPPLLATLYITVVFNTFCWPMTSMVPVIAQERLHLGARGAGLLASADGLGALLVAIALATGARRLWHGHVYLGGTILFLLLMPAFALSTDPWLSGAVLLAIGVGQGAFAIMQPTLVFLTAPPLRRLEAMGLMTMSIGIAPLGFALMGWMAERFGASGAIVASAICGLVTVALSWRACRPCLQRHAEAPASPVA